MKSHLSRARCGLPPRRAFAILGVLGVPEPSELQSGWRMTSAKNVGADDFLVSQPSFDASQWYTAQHMPATVLQILQENASTRTCTTA